MTRWAWIVVGLLFATQAFAAPDPGRVHELTAIVTGIERKLVEGVLADSKPKSRGLAGRVFSR